MSVVASAVQASSEQTETPSRGARLQVVAVVAVIAAAALMLAGLLGYGLGGRSAHPDDTSPEAGFARDMQAHHAQAVQMSSIIRDKTTDPTLRSIAYDISTSQQQQAGQMYGWLAAWGLPQTSSEPSMAWMSSAEGGHDMADMGGKPSGPTATMPGMASAEDVQRLQKAEGVAAERLFLQLMIAHHQGGVEMAQSVLKRTGRPEVTTLARSIVTAQSAEIEQLRQLLEARR